MEIEEDYIMEMFRSVIVIPFVCNIVAEYVEDDIYICILEQLVGEYLAYEGKNEMV